MQWTKAKSLIENLWCKKLIDSLSIHLTSYHATHGLQKRIWMTMDGKEIFHASTAAFLMEHDKLWGEVKKASNKHFPSCLYEYYPEFAGKVHDMDYTMLILEQRNIFNVDRVYGAIVEYPNLSIEEALNSEIPFIQAMAMVDKRVGKRKLQAMQLNSDSHLLVWEFYQLRCEIEGIAARLKK